MLHVSIETFSIHLVYSGSQSAVHFLFTVKTSMSDVLETESPFILKFLISGLLSKSGQIYLFNELLVLFAESQIISVGS